MKNKTVETIIIGGGVAGLGCAHRLTEHNRDFIMITEDTGGKILVSEDGKVNYGAYFVLANYRHVLPLVRKGARLHPFFVEFHDTDNQPYRLVNLSGYPLQAIRLLVMLYKFKSRYRKFKIRCEQESQQQVIRSDPYLKKLYTRSAEEYAKEMRIEAIAREFLSEGIYMCTFLPLSKVSAFDFMRLCLALVLPAYEFTFLPERAVEGFAGKIAIDSVVEINGKKVTTAHGHVFRADNIVVATPPHVSRKLLNLPALKLGSDAYLFHIEGKLRPQWTGGQFELFSSDSPVIFIRKQSDASYIIYSKDPEPEFEKYFEQFSIIFQKHWDPAFHITGDALLSLEHGQGIYLAGEHNLIGLEDAYISGLLAANRIISTSVSNIDRTTGIKVHKP
ncbi:MAG: FAD-dependent oxidoreductase [Bacteroidetes bacterium]|nr:FAD-dependent oxidoreductase [Bacteroidota bacterium]